MSRPKARARVAIRADKSLPGFSLSIFYAMSVNFRFGSQQLDTIIEFLFLKPEQSIIRPWAAARTFKIAHFGPKLPPGITLPQLTESCRIRTSCWRSERRPD